MSDACEAYESSFKKGRSENPFPSYKMHTHVKSICFKANITIWQLKMMYLGQLLFLVFHPNSICYCSGEADRQKTQKCCPKISCIFGVAVAITSNLTLKRELEQ